jgi:hypothetical protein
MAVHRQQSDATLHHVSALSGRGNGEGEGGQHIGVELLM